MSVTLNSVIYLRFLYRWQRMCGRSKNFYLFYHSESITPTRYLFFIKVLLCNAMESILLSGMTIKNMVNNKIHNFWHVVIALMWYMKSRSVFFSFNWLNDTNRKCYIYRVLIRDGHDQCHLLSFTKQIHKL